MRDRIIIFGATSAIAIETARLFAAEGAELFLVARDEEKLRSVRGDLVVRGAGRVENCVADLDEFSKHQELFERAAELLGGIDIVLIAHGSLGDQKECEKDFSHAENQFRTNFLSVVSILTPIANHFEAEGRGIIAVISSVAGDRGRQSNYIYGAAKGAVSIYLQGLRNRLTHCGTTVITIKPGLVDSPMTSKFTKSALWSQTDLVGYGIYRAIKNRRDVVYLPWFWLPIMGIIKLIPEFVFKRLRL